MRVAVIGGTGFVGSYIVDRLLASGHEVSQLVRKGSEQKLRHPNKTRVVVGDIQAAESLVDVMSDCAAVIYSVGILREFPQREITFEAMQFDGVANTIMAAKANGVERLLLMSANGANCPGTRYQETKKRAEDLALASGLDVTIFRPSVIFGDPRGRMEFATQLYRDMVSKPLPAFSFYSGASPTGGAVEMSPIHIQDLARGLVNSLDNMATFGKIFSLGGPDVLSWPEMIRRIASATGREKWLIPTPIVLMKLLATLLDWLPFFPVTRDQLTMLAEGNTAAPDAIKSLTGDPPISFSVSRLQYLRA